MFDIHTENLIPVKDIPRHAPGRPHIATGWRWIKRGCRGVRLETVLVGGRRFTSTEAIARFVEATTAAADGTYPVTSATTAAARRSHEQAERELDGDGI